jgi:DNA-binding transcriptional LysR family regulator
MLRNFHDTYPDIVLDITLDDEVVDMVAGGFDAAIRVGEVIERDMIAVKLGPDLRQVAVASPDYLARHGTPENPRDLHAHACINWRWPGHEQPYRWEFSENDKWFEVVVDGPLVVNSREFAVQAAIDGVGIAFAVEDHVAPLIAEGRLAPLLKEWAAPFPGFYLCYPAQRHMAPALRVFIDSLNAIRAKP